MTRVLVVEDNPAIRELVSAYVKGAGHSVATASNGDEALETVAERGAPDIAVLDVAMPGMSGLDLLVKLRELPGHAELPAIFLSASARETDIRRGHELGAAYLTKPFAAHALLDAVDEAVTGRPQPSATEHAW